MDNDYVDIKCMYIYMHIHIYIYMYCMSVCLSVCMYACMYVCMYVYTYMHTYACVHAHVLVRSLRFVELALPGQVCCPLIPFLHKACIRILVGSCDVTLVPNTYFVYQGGFLALQLGCGFAFVGIRALKRLGAWKHMFQSMFCACLFLQTFAEQRRNSQVDTQTHARMHEHKRVHAQMIMPVLCMMLSCGSRRYPIVGYVTV